MTRVLLAFDKFKDALSADAAGETVATVLREQHPDWIIDEAPLADGGEGFAAILTRSARGRMVTATASGPRGSRRTAEFGLVPIGNIPESARQQLLLPTTAASGPVIAVVEMASISGLALLASGERDPWHTTSVGTGELIVAAAEAGAAAILLGVGGSATHDLGLGALSAMGLQFADAKGSPVQPPTPARWGAIAAITGRAVPTLPPIFIACDVTNPLLGPRGAAAVYGPQKGLKAGDLARLEVESARLADQLCRHCQSSPDTPNVAGAGAAGGIAFGLMAAAGAKLLPGFALVSAWLELEAKLAAADIVVTGEGRFDESSLEGKGPGSVANRALALGKRVEVFAGKVSITPRPGLSAHAITPAGQPLDQALANAARNLATAARRVFAG